MNTKHTPGPLHVHPGSPSVLRDSDNNCIAQDCGRFDAERLALCWNTHDELLAALEKCHEAICDSLAPLSEEEIQECWQYKALNASRKKARAALEKARGE